MNCKSIFPDLIYFINSSNFFVVCGCSVGGGSVHFLDPKHLNNNNSSFPEN